MRGCELCGRRFVPAKEYYVLCDICFSAYNKVSAYDIRLEISKRDALFGFACAYCKGKVQAWDHIVPRSLLSPYIANRPAGEAFSLGLGSNLAPTCKSCNSTKGARDLTWFYAYTGFRKVGGLSRLEEIIMSHRFAPEHWLEFLEYAKELPHSQIQIALNRIAPRVSAWEEEQGQFPTPPLLATPKGFYKGQEISHPTFGLGVITDFEIVLSQGKEDEYLVANFERGPIKLLASVNRSPQEKDQSKAWQASDSPWGCRRVVPPKVPTKAKPSITTIFKAGDRVRHAKFGVGVVIGSAPTGADEEVTVVFLSDAPKKLLASFAHLEKIGA